MKMSDPKNSPSEKQSGPQQNTSALDKQQEPQQKCCVPCKQQESHQKCCAPCKHREPLQKFSAPCKQQESQQKCSGPYKQQESRQKCSGRPYKQKESQLECGASCKGQESQQKCCSPQESQQECSASEKHKPQQTSVVLNKQHRSCYTKTSRPSFVSEETVIENASTGDYNVVLPECTNEHFSSKTCNYKRPRGLFIGSMEIAEPFEDFVVHKSSGNPSTGLFCGKLELPEVAAESPEQLAETEPVRYSDGSSHYKPYSRDNDVEVQNAKQKFHSSYCHQEVFDDASPITTVVHQSEQRRSRACQVDSNPSHYVPAEAAHSGMVFTTLQKGTSKTFKISDLDLPYVYFNYSLAPSDGKTVGCGQPLCDTKGLNSSQQSCDMCGIVLQESKVSPEQTAEDWRRFEHNSSVLEDFINSKEEPMDTSEPAGGDPTPPHSFEMVLGPETLSSETDNGAKLFEDALRIDDQENVQPKGQPKCRPDKDMEPSIPSRVIYDKNNEAWQVIDVGGDVVEQLGQSLMDCSTKL